MMTVAHAWEEARRHDEPAPPGDTDGRARLRTAGERDRDRVLYSTAFQRLAGITQVVPAGAGQAVHSRLTHSLKVAQVARRLAQRVLESHPALGPELDPDSVEASALVHDLGHPPFGHIAEKELNRFACSKGTDGFEGNAQSFRLVTRLAQRWPTSHDGEDWGLNLTRRTLDGMLKYPWLRNPDDTLRERKWGAYRNDAPAFEWVRERRRGERPSPAAQIMDWADDLTYAVHDMEDFYRAGLIPLDRLCTSETERDRFVASFRDADGDLNVRLKDFAQDSLTTAVDEVFRLLDVVRPYAGTRYDRQILRERTSFLIRDFMRALVVEPDGQMRPDSGRHAEVAVLKEMTWFYVIRRQDLATVQDGQRRIVRDLCERFWRAAKDGERHLFPWLEQESLERANTDSLKARVVCDFIARLTEARAIVLHQRLLGTSVPFLPPPAH
jgi:dGTPase